MPVPVLPVPCPLLEYPSKVRRLAHTPRLLESLERSRPGEEPVRRREMAPERPAIAAVPLPVAGAIGLPWRNTPTGSLPIRVGAERSRNRQVPALQTRETLARQQRIPRCRRWNLQRD